jgi:ribonuclease HII
MIKASLLAGVDEAGRGALAGPVVSAAVILTDDIPRDCLKDSKSLSKKERENVYNLIVEKTPYIGIGIVSIEKIDSINILQATLISMEKAIRALPTVPDEIMIDGNKSPKLPMYKIKTIVKGDQRISEISAASIIAKVTRDQIMAEYHQRYPQYNFQENNGYGTEQHYESIFQYGISKIHRKSFNLTRQPTLFHT